MINGNAEKLRDAGLIADAPLPDNYYEVIEGLTDDEIEVLISLKRRLDEAGIPTQPLHAAAGLAEAKSVVIL